jgi:hypothetical protein
MHTSLSNCVCILPFSLWFNGFCTHRKRHHDPSPTQQFGFVSSAESNSLAITEFLCHLSIAVYITSSSILAFKDPHPHTLQACCCTMTYTVSGPHFRHQIALFLAVPNHVYQQCLMPFTAPEKNSPPYQISRCKNEC